MRCSLWNASTTPSERRPPRRDFSSVNLCGSPLQEFDSGEKQCHCFSLTLTCSYSGARLWCWQSNRRAISSIIPPHMGEILSSAPRKRAILIPSTTQVRTQDTETNKNRNKPALRFFPKALNGLSKRAIPVAAPHPAPSAAAPSAATPYDPPPHKVYSCCLPKHFSL